MKIKVSLPVLDSLKEIILKKPYRTGTQLMSFFDHLDNDIRITPASTSRGRYTDAQLKSLNKAGRIQEVIEQAVDPRHFSKSDKDGDEVVSELNSYLKYDGLILVEDNYGYSLQTISGSQFDENVKNIIFASTGAKPDMILSDALTNKIEIVRNAEYCLIYDKPISRDGLWWSDLVQWWSDLKNKSINKSLEKELYKRLYEAIPDSSPPAQELFKSYYAFHRTREDLPALLPEVYLHFDPKTLKERNGFEFLKRQRMDFLVLLPDDVRVVIEVDGKQHYSQNNIASPKLYSDMISADRELQLLGYEVYRFGGYELNQNNGEKISQDFFKNLFARHLESWS